MPRPVRCFALILICPAMRKFAMRFKTILFVIFVTYSIKASTQNNISDSLRIDSLKKVLQTQKEDTNKVNTLNELSRNLVKSEQSESAFQYANNALLLAEK